MPTLQDLTIAQISETLAAAAERHVPLAMTMRSGRQWVSLRSTAIAFDGSRLMVESPLAADRETPHELAPAERIGVNFKLKHYKHLFSATVAGRQNVVLADGSQIGALALCCPTKMHRLQRRAYLRADVPAGRIVRASVWLGGRDNEPAGTSPERPVWSGQVTNLSAGGFQMRTARPAGEALEANDLLGVRMIFGAGQDAIYADAQFRHAVLSDPTALLGFQFIGLGDTPDGLAVLKFLSNRVSEFHQMDQNVAARRK